MYLHYNCSLSVSRSLIVYLSTEAACLGDAVDPVEAGLGGHQQEVVAAADEVVSGHLDKVYTEFL